MQAIRNIDKCVENNVRSKESFRQDYATDGGIVESAFKPLRRVRVRCHLHAVKISKSHSSV